MEREGRKGLLTHTGPEQQQQQNIKIFIGTEIQDYLVESMKVLTTKKDSEIVSGQM